MGTKLKQTISLVFMFGLILMGLLTCKAEQATPAQLPTNQIPTKEIEVDPLQVRQTSTKQISRQQPRIGCPQIQENALRSLEFGKLSPEAMQAWLKEAYSVKDIEISPAPYSYKGIGALIWDYGGVRYDARFRKEILTRISGSWFYQGEAFLPTGQEVIACLGEPELYQAVRSIDPGGTYIQFSLWYLEKGLIVSAYPERLRYYNQLPSIDSSLLMYHIDIVAPDTAEEMIRDAYTAGDQDNIRSEILITLTPWPGRWEDVKVRGCFEFKNCPD